ncbi:hypothetical protein [Flavobacterium psychrophilum]|uniref:hypothetical protein n=1 Tax=Flavobacterium psychrophilum TaxID=96345 RepID=UPI000B7C4B99|nr:hypothetical protein [Flavobacterium psychrophilum]MCB6087589.1 hypothetical protein [Flavobacterium psychrophilum]SNA66708.1 hypothetical protein DK095_130012 [Flavobacterium psychrophilum]
MKKKYNSYPFIENLNNDFNYIQLNEQLSDGAINLIIKAKDGTNVNVYSAGLWHILISDEFANEGFIDAYTKGFRNGKNFIEDKTNKALNGFYKSRSDEYINELRHAYFFKSDNYILGYKNGAYGVPTMFYIDNIESIGFASGVVCTIDLMAKENPILFDGFYDNNTEQPQQIKIGKPKNEFKDFFNTDVNISVIEKIQDDFKEYYGKKMAMLIYLLETEFNLITYSLDSKTDSRKHFVDSLNKSKTNMQPINKSFVPYTYRLDITNFEKNKDFVRIKEKLQETIK